MKRHQYLFCFLTGVFLTNALPHLIHGIDGDAFPTPFASPPGVGLSSPLTNVIWALFNVALGLIFFRISAASKTNAWSIAMIFSGAAVVSIAFSLLAPSMLVNFKTTH
jgi:hypothetical protein